MRADRNGFECKPEKETIEPMQPMTMWSTVNCTVSRRIRDDPMAHRNLAISEREQVESAECRTSCSQRPPLLLHRQKSMMKIQSSGDPSSSSSSSSSSSFSLSLTVLSESLLRADSLTLHNTHTRTHTLR